MHDHDYICNREKIDITIIDQVHLVVIDMKNWKLRCTEFSIVMVILMSHIRDVIVYYLSCFVMVVCHIQYNQV